MSARNLPIALLALLLLVSMGCNESTLVRPSATEVHYQNPPTQVDILLVVDNSCSMQDEQDKLSEGFDAFVEFFDVADVDYHIGITTTDMDAEAGALVNAGGDKVITRDTDDAAQVFQDNVRVGIEGSAAERGLDAAFAALSEPLRSGANDGFFREDALLSVIFVSDEEDSSVGPVNSFINAYRELKGQRRRDAFNASSLVGVSLDDGSPADCGQSVNNPNLGAVAGWRYYDVARQTGGVNGSICEDDFAGIVSEMGLASSRLLQRFTLQRQPREDSVEITLYLPDGSEEGDEVIVPPEGTPEGEFPWELVQDEEAQLFEIVFTDLTSLPPLDTRIVVRYDFL